MPNPALAYFVLHSIPVLTAVLFGMISVWAVQSPWPGAVRLTVISAAIWGVFHVSGFLIVLWYAFGTAFFMAGLFVMHGWQARAAAKSSGQAAPPVWPRVSVRDLFMLTAGVGIVLAIGINSPKLTADRWLGAALSSWAYATTGLACCAIALGRSRWQIRAIAGPFVLMAAIALIAVCNRLASAASFSISQRRVRSLSMEATWQDFLGRVGGFWTPFAERWLAAVVCAALLFCAWLFAARSVGWISWPSLPVKASTRPRQRRTKQTLAWLVSIAIAALPMYFAGRWVLRPALPKLSDRELSLYHEVVDLGEKMIAKDGGDINAWSQLSDAQFRAKLARDAAELSRFREIIRAGCRFPWREPYTDHPDRYALAVPAVTLLLRMERGGVTGSLQERIDACLEAKQLLKAEQATSGFGGSVYAEAKLEPDRVLWELRAQMTAQQCQEVITFLEQYERDREPWDEVEQRDLRLKEHLSASVRAGNMVRAWIVDDAEFNERIRKYYSLVPRMVLAELAIRRFELEHGRLPDELAQLTPEVLSELPEDPYGGGPLCYQRTPGGYLLYSVGPNQVDDGGTYTTGPGGIWLADVTLNGLFPARPLPRRLAPPPATKPAPADRNTEPNESKTSAAFGDERRLRSLPLRRGMFGALIPRGKLFGEHADRGERLCAFGERVNQNGRRT